MPEGISECEITVPSGRIDFDIHIEMEVMCSSSPGSRDSLMGFARQLSRMTTVSKIC